MQKSAHFRVDPRLAHVLGEIYSSSEKALKELVDNAWDADDPLDARGTGIGHDKFLTRQVRMRVVD